MTAGNDFAIFAVVSGKRLFLIRTSAFEDPKEIVTDESHGNIVSFHSFEDNLVVVYNDGSVYTIGDSGKL